MKTTQKQVLSGSFSTALTGAVVAGILFAATPVTTVANPNIRNAFFDVYTNAVGTPLYTLSSVKKEPHCGVCHKDFQNGGPPWNPYGELVRSNLDNNPGWTYAQAILAAASEDPDGDGFTSGVEITSTSYDNTPTFPGWSPANVDEAVNVLFKRDFIRFNS